MNKQGMTMVEMIAVILIISVVTAIALPAVDNFRSSERCKAEASKLVDSIRQAKYLAMQDNTLIRIAFSPDGDAYKVQRYEGNESTYHDAIRAEHTGASDLLRYNLDDNYWASLTDEDEISVDSSLEIEIPSSLVGNCIYFKPDGYAYYWDASSKELQIPEQIVKFKYGSSAIAVEINYFGVISSETIPPEDDDYFESSGSSGGTIQLNGGKIGTIGGNLTGEGTSVVVPSLSSL